ncbi:CheR family methyltransferase [Sulfurimonas sp.]|uniref:CheR family methyltransferase n=1 Tax=Sulfurimonas sp. TaxID=2022749 RepID=UPI002B466263|nr:CheR family methyltransferase [Sulfurimonas sp.]
MFNFFKKVKEKQINVEVQEPTDYVDVTIIARYFKNETGVDFDKQIDILKNKVMIFCKQRDINSFTKLLNRISTDKNIKQELIDCLTTNETFFYREFAQIEKLVNTVKTSEQEVKILCAPSATGEEPYSIAIALLESGVSSKKFKILGIDINNDALQKATKGIYKERNIKKLSSKIIDKYFDVNNDSYILNASIKNLVTFKLANLFDESFKKLGKFDYILSRNMLIYFDKETKNKAKNILESMRKNDNQEIFFGHADLF